MDEEYKQEAEQEKAYEDEYQEEQIEDEESPQSELREEDMTLEQLREIDEQKHKNGEPSLRLGYYQCSKCDEILQVLKRSTEEGSEGVLELDGEESFQLTIRHLKKKHNIDA